MGNSLEQRLAIGMCDLIAAQTIPSVHFSLRFLLAFLMQCVPFLFSCFYLDLFILIQNSFAFGSCSQRNFLDTSVELFVCSPEFSRILPAKVIIVVGFLPPPSPQNLLKCSWSPSGDFVATGSADDQGRQMGNGCPQASPVLGPFVSICKTLYIVQFIITVKYVTKGRPLFPSSPTI